MSTQTDYFKTFSVFNEKWAEFTKTVYEPVSEFQKITTEAIERTTKQNMKAYDALMSSSTDKAKKLTNIKKLEELTEFYRNASKEANDEVMAYTKASIDNLTRTSTELTQWFEKGANQVKKQTKASAK